MSLSYMQQSINVLFIVYATQNRAAAELARMQVLADVCKKQGDEVAFFTTRELSRMLDSRGYISYYPQNSCSENTFQKYHNAIQRKYYKKNQGMNAAAESGSGWYRFLESGFSSSRMLDWYITAQVEAIKTFKPDVIVTDLDPGACVSAALTGTPCVTTFFQSEFLKAELPGYHEFRHYIERVIFKAGYRFPTTMEDVYMGENTLKLIPTIPEISRVDVQLEHYRHTGPFFEELLPAARESAPAAADDGSGKPAKRRCICCYPGSRSVPLDRYEEILPQLFPDSAIALVYVVHPGIERPYQKGAVQFVDALPASVPFSSIDCLVSHGSLELVNRAIAHGIPHIIFPGQLEPRRVIAQSVVGQNCGVMGEQKDFCFDWLAEAFKRCQTFEIPVERLQQHMHVYTGADKARDEILAWLGISQHYFSIRA